MTNKKTIYNLQIFRGIAALIVLLGHANVLANKNLFHGIFIQGYCGVDFFFVLSGFIIYYNNCDDFGNMAKAFPFLKKRIIRVLPTLWIYSLLAVVLSLFLSYTIGKNLIDQWMVFTPVNVIKSLLLYPFPNDANHCSLLPPSWSLTYEMFFYFIFFILMLIPKKAGVFVVILWIAAIISNASNIFQLDVNSGLRFAVSLQNFEFFFGCLTAHIFKYGDGKKVKRFAFLCAIIGTIGILISWLNINLGYKFFQLHRVIMFGLPFALIIYGGVLLEPNVNNPISKTRKFFIFLGEASYSIYLTHFISIYLLCSFFKLLHSLAIFAISVVISIIIGCSAYLLIEKPLLITMRKILSPHPGKNGAT